MAQEERSRGDYRSYGVWSCRINTRLRIVTRFKFLNMEQYFSDLLYMYMHTRVSPLRGPIFLGEEGIALLDLGP